MGDFGGSGLPARTRADIAWRDAVAPPVHLLGDPAGAAAGHSDSVSELDRLQTIFRLAPLGIGIVDPAGHTVMANETLRLLLGYSEVEFAEMTWLDYTHPDDVALNVEMYARMEAGETDQFSLEKRFICKDRSILWVHLTSSMVRRPDGTPQYQIGMVQDITDRKRLEHELRTAEQH